MLITYLVKFNKDTIVNLPQPEQLEGLANFRAHLVYTEKPNI